MTPLEELQAAHKRLSKLRQVSDKYDPAPWVLDDMVITAHIAANGGTGDICYDEGGGVFDGDTADLIVTLHRTIDAQLAIIQRAIDWYVEEAMAYIGPEDLALARAINGNQGHSDD